MLYSCKEHKDAIVVYDGYHCPICDEIEELNNDIEGYKEEVTKYEMQIEDMENEKETS